MKWRAAKFWHSEAVSDAASRAEIEACREWTPFLTALFDGEADEKEALAARRHLLICERCARAWLDWNQTRHLLLLHAAPPAPPPNLLWRVRLACRLGQSATATPELSAQILERTSRKGTRPAHPLWTALRAAFASPLPRTLVLAAFALFMARGALMSSNAVSGHAAHTSEVASGTVALASDNVHSVTVAADAPILTPLGEPVSNAPRSNEAEMSATQSASDAGESLARARRELEGLPIRTVSVALPATDAPLPMLNEARFESRPTTSTVQTRVHRVRSAVRATRPVASPAHFAAPAVVLASVPAPSPETAQPSVVRAPRRLFASLAEAPLRISAPRFRPITLTQPANPDEPGLDELDSTVQEYRATLIDSPAPDTDTR